ncbi:MAG: tetratricopeptide repeat protein [Spirochaetales bacterium]|nr:tetratricopeptide repeat protein [Spirochaetales bacterium]
MPKAVQYKANSIVYFQGDINENVYILKTGKVGLRYSDIETGQEINDLIQTGEFFGVKSALGKYPREETAIVLQDSAMLVFTVPEFEQVCLNNTRIIMKMLRIFSNQLRRIHKQVRNLISSGEQLNPETGLFRIGEYYNNRGNFKQAMYAFRRYLTYYPTGKYANEATENLQRAEGKVQAGAGRSPSSSSAPASGREMSDIAKSYYNAVSLFSQQKLPEALKEFQKIINESDSAEYSAKSHFEIGRCFFALNDFDRCIQHYTAMIQKYPKHPDLVEALFFVGNCYEKKKDMAKAGSFYSKILSMAQDDTPVYRKAKRALDGLKGE